jgi:uncharacterized protein YjaZ
MAFAKAAIHDLRKDGAIETAGYTSDLSLQRAIAKQTGSFGIDCFQAPTLAQRSHIARTIHKGIAVSSKCLALPNVPLWIFVFPWFPAPKLGLELAGVNAIAVHASVMHIYIDMHQYTDRSLLETVVHEYTHHAYYQYRPKRKYTLLEHMLMEGIAERFREEVVGGESAPWATALSPRRATLLLKELMPLATNTSKAVINDVMYGSRKYPRWAGYSIGYQLVGAFRKSKPDIDWDEVIIQSHR